MNNEAVSIKSVVFFSLGLILCGILLLFYPLISFLTLYLVLGFTALFRGVMLVVTFFRSRGTSSTGRFSILTLGVILSMIGVGFLFAPAFMTSIFAYIMAFWFIIDGAAGLFRRKEVQSQGKGLYTFNMIMSIIILIGGISLLFNPLIISVAIPVIIGINVMALGISSMVMAFALKKASKA